MSEKARDLNLDLNPKLIPSVYFHGNYYIYRNHDNIKKTKQDFSFQKLFFSIVTTTSSTVSPTMSKCSSFHWLMWFVAYIPVVTN